VAGLFVAFLAYCLGPSLIGLNTLLGVNLLSNFYPWIALHGSDLPGHQSCVGDTVDSGMPGIAHVRSQLFAGHLADWQSVVAGGSPLAGVPDLGLLNPLALPYWIMPLWLAPAFVMLLQILVAAGGTFLFLRQFRVSRAAGILAGLIFATSGFLVEWTNWPQARVAAFIPALFWSIERLVQRRRWRDTVLIALVVASMLLGGFPAVTGYALYMGAAYLLVRVVTLQRTELRAAGRTVLLAASGLVIGALLSMVQLLPFAYFYAHSALGYRAAEGTGGLPLSGLLTVFAPNAYGLCVFPQTARGGSNSVELVAYVGAAALLLGVAGAAFGFARWRAGGGDDGTGDGGAGGDGVARSGAEREARSADGRAAGWDDGRVEANRFGVRGFFVVASVVIILLGWASPTLRSIVSSLPVFAGNFIGRIRSVLGFALAVLAGIGFDWLVTRRRSGPATDPAPELAPDPTPDPAAELTPAPAPGPVTGQPARGGRRLRHRAWVALVVAATVATAVIVVRQAHQGAFRGGYVQPLRNALIVPAILLVLAAVAALIGRVDRPHLKNAAFVVIPLLVAGQAAQYVHAVHPGDNKANFYPDTPTHQFLAAHLGQYRFSASSRTMYTPTALYYNLRTPTGHEFQEPAWKDLLEAVDPKVMNTPTFSDFTNLTSANVGDQPILDLMGVKYFVSPPSDVAGQVAPLPAPDGSRPAETAPGCGLPGGGIRGVAFVVAHTVTASNPTAGLTLNVVVRDGDQVLESGRYMGASVTGGSEVVVGVAGEGLPAGGHPTVTMSVSGAVQPLDLATTGGAVECEPVRPEADGLRLVFADSGSVVYQRLTAEPRIRWASSDTVVRSGSAQVAALQVVAPADRVVLDQPGPTAAGRPAAVSVGTDQDDRISVQVDAQGGGYLVVADALQQPGWSATVDGHQVVLVPAEHAMVAVYVPAGHHAVALSYSTPAQTPGLVLSLVGVVLLLMVAAPPGYAARFRRRGRRRPEEAE
jgi:Bacterial membrane protein YfhO